MTTHKEALTLALELLAVGTFHSPELQAKRTEVIEQGLNALAQPEQEPVAWMYPDALCDRSCLYVCTKAFTQFPECATTPPQRKLTDEQIREIWVEHGCEGEDAEGFARAIEAAHGIKE